MTRPMQRVYKLNYTKEVNGVDLYSYSHTYRHDLLEVEYIIVHKYGRMSVEDINGNPIPDFDVELVLAFTEDLIEDAREYRIDLLEREFFRECRDVIYTIDEETRQRTFEVWLAKRDRRLKEEGAYLDTL